MKSITEALARTCLTGAMLLCSLFLFSGSAFAQQTSEVPAFPNDMSVAGLQAMTSQSGDSSVINILMAPEALNAVREFVYQTQKLGKTSRAGVLSISTAPTNVRANNPAGDAVGETQAEVAVAVNGDTVVIGWNDSKGFLAGFTVSSFGYSTDGGVTFVDGGNMPLQVATDQAFGDPGVDTDEQGNWYYNQIYTKTGQQNIGVHHGKFVGGVLVWDTPVMASIGTSATGALDKCLLACDRVTGNVYVAYTRFTAVPRIEIVRSTTKGASWDPAVVLDATTTPTSSKQAARPFCGPNGEVYVVWEKGANFIYCPDGLGNVSNGQAQIAFTRSLNFGASYDPFTVIGLADHSWMWSGPGDLRERANEFPDIGVDRSGGPFNGNIYVTWHESAPWTANVSAGPVRNEAADATNNNPGGAELFNVGDDVNGSMSSNGDLDYWQFSAVQGQNLLFVLDPQGFVCGVSGTSRGMRMRLFATQSPYPNPTGFPDSLLAASAQGTFEDRIEWTAPKTGAYLVRLQRSSGVTPFTYRLLVRNLTFGTPSPARDARDVVVVRSTNQGASWSAEQRINDDVAGLENRRPFICVDGLGRVHTFWHDSRVPGLGSNAALTSIFGTTSIDGGNTWSSNYLVSDELSFFSFNTLAVPNLGDYNQAAATASGLVHPAWSDQRLSTGDVRTPGTNTFTAGLGPETYTTALSPPAISCPANMAVNNDPGKCSAVMSFTVTATGVPTPTIVCSPASGSAFPVGTTTVTCTASNGIGSPATCSFTVTVNDVEAPTISVSVNPSSLWTPNHNLANITATVTATDNCPGVSYVLTSITSNEPDNGLGDGDTPNDIQGAAFGTPDLNFKLRAERSGTGSGRVYTVTYTATDAAGNTKSGTATVTVPLNQSKETAANEMVSIPERFDLAQNHPNPFNPATVIRYDLPIAANVRLEVYNIHGQSVAQLVDERKPAGSYEVIFDASRIANGMYFYRLSTVDVDGKPLVMMKKMLVVK